MTKRIPVRVGVACGVGSLACLAASFPSPAAARKPITGKLSVPGYTVLALKANGKATSVRARTGKFRLKPPARVTTLHLRTKHGIYGGPIVLAKKNHGKRALVGVRAGGRLGPITVKAGKGYAKLRRRPPKRFIDLDRYARARQGIPIGAGNFGRVRSKHTSGGVPGDLDLDGIPGPLDIDDDGDLILDNIDRHPRRYDSRHGASRSGLRPTAARAALAGNDQADLIGLQSHLFLELDQTVNANASAVTLAQIDAALAAFGELQIGIVPGDSTQLDCGGKPDPDNPDGWIGGLSYCTRGGTGSAAYVTPPPNPPFPECCDPDKDGFGTLTGGVSGAPGSFFLAHGATAAQIGTGDVLIERVTTSGEESQFPATLQDVFATVPALVSYSDAAGNCAKVSGTAGSCATEFSYPVAPSDPGTQGNGFQAAPSPGTDVLLTLTFWRPQRMSIPGEGGDFMDIGGLVYLAVGGPNFKPCPQSAYSTEDPNLTTASTPASLGGGGLRDLTSDRPASPANTLTYTLNVTQCLQSLGGSWGPGQEIPLSFMATTQSGLDKAVQRIYFRRP